MRRVDAGAKHFTYNQLGLGTEKDASGTTSFTPDNEGTLVSMRAPAGTSYYLLDALGSVVGVVDSAGDVVKRYEYEPYGQAIPTTGSHANPWRFASGYLDASGFTKFGTRYYVPSLARWTQHDPKRGQLSNPKTLNLYAYAGCDPINYVNPTGRHGAIGEPDPDPEEIDLAVEVTLMLYDCLEGASIGLAVTGKLQAPRSVRSQRRGGRVDGVRRRGDYGGSFRLNDAPRTARR